MAQMTVFVSHSSQDAGLALCFTELLEKISSNLVQVECSSKDGSIRSGDNWIDWIYTQVAEAHSSFILLTPSSLSGKWVLWEAGAVAGVKRMASGVRPPDSLVGVKDAPIIERRVLPIKFRIPEDEKMGPFDHVQVVDGLKSDRLSTLLEQFLESLRSQLAPSDQGRINKSMRFLNQSCDEFVEQADQILQNLPIHQRQDLVLEWASRLDANLKNNPAFVRSARRWINIAFLGPEKADDKETPIDFRLHSRLAEGFRRLKEWARAKEQLLLAQQLSPRDMLVLRELGRAELEANSNNTDDAKADAARAASAVFEKMERYDPQVLTADDEALNLKVRIFVASKNWAGAHRVLSSARNLAQESSYVANMRAIAALKTGSADAKSYFDELLERERSAKPPNIWSQGNMINAALALGKAEEAERCLAELAREREARENFDSISRYFDEIAQWSKINYDWKARWKALVQESEATSASS
jgi:hypothetical protein